MPTGSDDVRLPGKTGSGRLTGKTTRLTHSGSWMFGRIFGLDGRESYRKLRLFRYVALTVKAEVLRAGS